MHRMQAQPNKQSFRHLSTCSRNIWKGCAISAEAIRACSCHAARAMQSGIKSLSGSKMCPF